MRADHLLEDLPLNAHEARRGARDFHIAHRVDIEPFGHAGKKLARPPGNLIGLLDLSAVDAGEQRLIGREQPHHIGLVPADIVVDEHQIACIARHEAGDQHIARAGQVRLADDDVVVERNADPA